MEQTKELLKKDILNIVGQCINCRFCLPSCPLFEITRDNIAHGASGIIQSLYWIVKWGETDREILTELRDILYSCATCRNCELACKLLSTGVNLVDTIEKGRQLLIEEMVGPMPDQIAALESLDRYGNPYGMLPGERKNWMTALGVPSFSSGNEFDVLFYVGCTAPHDPLVGRIAKSIVQLLVKAQVQFGILEDEVCCGSPSSRMGEELLSDSLHQANVEHFTSLGVKHIITLSPHCFDTFLNRYPKETMEGIRVQHYSQFLAELIDQGRLVPKNRIQKTLTYHDSCYLGRGNDIYDIPRKIINSLPGVNFIEFTRCKENGLCCGGGGGRMWSDFKAEIERMANIRVKEALEIGAEIIVTACPFCLINIEDGIKSVNAEDSLLVKDLAELLAESVD